MAAWSLPEQAAVHAHHPTIPHRFLCIREPQRGPPSALPHLPGKEASHTADILELCSGHFGSPESHQGASEGMGPSTQAMCELLGVQKLRSSSTPSPPHALLLSQQQEAAEADTNLLGLCSGHFSTPPLSAPQPLAPPPADTSDNAVDGEWSDEDMPVLRWKQTHRPQRPTER